jgi:hypothetical protein
MINGIKMAMSELSKKPTFETVPERSCGTCTLCCKVYPIKALEKPAAKWCTHCMPGKGCSVWGEQQPDQCRSFFCQWMYDATLGPEWKPDVARFVMNIQDGKALMVAVDPGHRNAWKREPYHRHFRQMALKLFDKNIMIIVGDGINKILVTPEDDIVISKQHENIACNLRRDVKGPIIKWIASIEGASSAA